VRLREIHGKLGVCLATSGPGAIHLLNGLYDAKMDGAPVLAITGQTYHDLIGTRYQQEVDLLSLFKDVALYNQQMLGAGHVRALVDAGCRAALSLRGVAHITCPGRSAGARGRRRRAIEEEGGRPHVETCGRRRSWCRAATTARAPPISERGHAHGDPRRPRRLGAGAELERLADLIAAPIVKPLLGKGVVPDDSPFTTGGIGLLGTAPSRSGNGEGRHPADGRHQLSPTWSSCRSTTAAARCKSTRIRLGSVCVFR
jgi:pyruvate dehydrogenase (quinone)/pyruvate oxidase